VIVKEYEFENGNSCEITQSNSKIIDEMMMNGTDLID
jgi:hypothetical protein